MSNPVASKSKWSFFAALLLAAFGLNWLWEMSHMLAYTEMAGRSWRETALTCTIASLGDMLITLGIYAVIALATRRLAWGMNSGWKGYAALALLGAVGAVIIELMGLATGRWSYASRMPIIPILGTGLWPLLQLMLLVPISLGIANWWSSRVQYK